eukprot:scaffold105988_cov13-Tisochrysis_lutea.AAC.1
MNEWSRQQVKSATSCKSRALQVCASNALANLRTGCGYSLHRTAGQPNGKSGDLFQPCKHIRACSRQLHLLHFPPSAHRYWALAQVHAHCALEGVIQEGFLLL